MDQPSPSSLPPITSVEVVKLAGSSVARVNFYMEDTAGLPSVTLHGAAAQRIADLWRSLPPGEQSRCHIPPYGVRFRAGADLVCVASICWQCDNIYGRATGVDVHYEFDSGSPVAQQLLSELHEVWGHP